MPLPCGGFNSPEALALSPMQQRLALEKEARRRAARLADARERGVVAARIEARYQERMSRPMGYDPSAAKWVPSYPWQGGDAA